MIILQTDRLLLREMQQSDYNDLANMLQNNETMYNSMIAVHINLYAKD